jgi:serine protease Do
LVRAPQELVDATAPYVCVRVTDMSDVDIAAIRFDFDLTMAVVLMHADGTIYHRYGSRPARDALAWMSIPSLVRLLHDTLDDHADHERAAHERAEHEHAGAPPAREPLRARELPMLQKRRAAGQKIECVHCHTVNDAEHEQALDQRRWRDDDKWVFPDPARIGLELDAGRQSLVRAVAADSAAARAGLRAGDRLVRLGAQERVRTVADVAWALHVAPPGDAALPVAFVRDGAETAATLTLPAGWKQCSPEDYAWRPYKWNLSPAAGFGGPALTPAEKAALGIAADRFAFRVTYIADWGERAQRGVAAAKAGVRKGDVVTAFAGKDDFASVEHFHAWIALTRHAGEEVEVKLLRDRQPITAKLRLVE